MKEESDFRHAYCHSRRIEHSRFDKALLREVLYPLGKPLSLIVLTLHPQFFSDELSMISKIGNTVEFDSFVAHRNKLIDYTLYQLAPWRKIVGIRTSGRKLLQIGNEVESPSFMEH
ncbi:hypothetical protein N8737_00665 [Verrucomicrobia bacterium]|jgi:hypothetical protein|nr:hypothetical protein [Verrucomicrobiota bacterium]